MIIETAARWLQEANHPLALTGAGVSAESGVPTFRGADGLWRTYRAEDLATPSAFERDPRLVWEWYDERRRSIAAKSPNAAHRILAAWESRFPSFHLITQNVDGLHQAAGSTRLVPMHGHIWETRCTREQVVEENREVPLVSIPPTCRRCGALLRPHIVWFGEPIPAEWMGAIQKLIAACDLLLVIGTSGIVFPAAGFAHDVKISGGRIIEVNPDETPLSDLSDLAFRDPAALILPQIDHALANIH